jgi:hypothetical protein
MIVEFSFEPQRVCLSSSIVIWSKDSKFKPKLEVELTTSTNSSLKPL